VSDRRALVFAGAPVHLNRRLRQRLAGQPPLLVVGADSGVETAIAWGLTPDAVVGDMDSISQATLRRLREAGARVDLYSRDKDWTDGELAARLALEMGANSVTLIGFVGGDRLDQTLANAGLLTRLPSGTELVDERNVCRVVRGGERCAWLPEDSEIISLIPLGGDACGVSTVGMLWTLFEEKLPLGDTRGLSNEPRADQVEVSLREGLLFLVRHFPESPET
jgi:thiamine pyrophosphokinase